MNLAAILFFLTAAGPSSPEPASPAVPTALAEEAAPRPPAALHLAAAWVAEARRLAGELNGLWPGLSDELRPVLVCVPGAGSVLVGGPADEGWNASPPSWSALDAGWRDDCPWSAASKEPNPLTRDGEGLVKVELGPLIPPVRLRSAPDDWREAEGGAWSGTRSENAVARILRGLIARWAWRTFAQPGVPRPPPPQELSRRVADLHREEARLLLEALESHETKEARALAGRIAELRRGRHAAAGRWAGGWWELDGLVDYTLYQAQRLARHDRRDVHPLLRRHEPTFRHDSAPHLREDLLWRLRRAASQPRGLSELTGFGYALLLDRTVHGWRQRLLEGRCFEEDGAGPCGFGRLFMGGGLSRAHETGESRAPARDEPGADPG